MVGEADVILVGRRADGLFVDGKECGGARDVTWQPSVGRLSGQLRVQTDSFHQRMALIGEMEWNKPGLET